MPVDWADSMKRALPLLLLAGLLTGTEATAAEPVLDEAFFLNSADKADRMGDTNGAVQNYQSAIVYAPNDPLPYLKLGEFYAKRDEAELAQRYYLLALDVEPAYVPALRGLALLDVARGDRAGALEQRELLLRACGASCPEIALVDKALSESTGVLDRNRSTQ